MSHDIMERKLRHYGLADSSVELTMSFLRGRATGPYSVIQGSTLGPICFLIYINDLPQAIPCDERVSFADDSTTLNTHREVQALLEKDKKTQESISDWMLDNRLTLNVDKTVEMFFSLRNTAELRGAESARLLGAHVDPTLSWRVHCERVAGQLSSLVYLLRNLANIINQGTLKMAYHGVFHSRMTYAILAWGHSPHAQSIFKIQRRVVRVIAGRGYRDDCRGDFRTLGIMTLPAVYLYRCAEMAYDKVQAGEMQPPTHEHSTRFATEGGVAVTRCRVEKVKNSTNYWAAKVYNGLKPSTRLLPRESFLRAIRRHLVEVAPYFNEPITWGLI